jgi:ElaB/YqjD/DUF883 family membrane-anchored ribosome-binding protein
MAKNSTSWLSRLARHEAPFREVLKAERQRKIFRTKEEEVLFQAGEEADRESETLKRELRKAVEEANQKLEDAQNHAAHLANRFLFEQARADAWKAACNTWAETALAGRRSIPEAALDEALRRQEKAERAERLQAVAVSRETEDELPTRRTPGHAEARDPHR